MRLSFLLFSLLPSLTLSTSFSVSIPSSNIIPNPSSLPPSTSASLTTLASTYHVPLNVANSFSFRNVSAGSYLFSIQCPTHIFTPLRIDVSNDGIVSAWRTYRGNEWDNMGEVMSVEESNYIEVRTLGAKEYYMERAGFSPLSILKNPMILIAGFTMIVVFGMPYLIDNMDPELRAEFEENRKKNPVTNLLASSGQQQSASSVANFDAAAWLAGSGKKSEGSKDQGVIR